MNEYLSNIESMSFLLLSVLQLINLNLKQIIFCCNKKGWNKIIY